MERVAKLESVGGVLVNFWEGPIFRPPCMEAATTTAAGCDGPVRLRRGFKRFDGNHRVASCWYGKEKREWKNDGRTAHVRIRPVGQVWGIGSSGAHV
ncbi:hypothetical protein JCGZ_11965 [Jatropha curcas]|uniref:Uncharacterized protein n=1 Tax=Jatropha curcas TaxID=180498 RepID=A0A067KEU9_JATCU|nr:hypothetical protein JCGZ_11965 [Jatropha curcas]